MNFSDILLHSNGKKDQMRSCISSLILHNFKKWIIGIYTKTVPFIASENFLKADVEDFILPVTLLCFSFNMSEKVTTLPSPDFGFLFLNELAVVFRRCAWAFAWASDLFDERFS